ncbi:hypothetical protein Q4F19_04655 [Sphingomonas sp. BIUV-7]|uniref:Uncharacterized protein n=1 Tax=Sphingomonas natans TaxID=3063330 RepID=A0ABT8Y5R8_9SPHN|nr:hypothetical protein [Sphingomonas sp. BIUV-7]MDO6413666.1 hypothetical protein [Sphingomonas sp. BIUV-7]
MDVSQKPEVGAFPASITEQHRAAPYIHSPWVEVSADRLFVEGDGLATLLAPRLLQDVADYRAMFRAWFAVLRSGGHLIITVPHTFLYERLLSLPSRWNPRQRRLYTPNSLMAEVEEALEANSYRVRLLCDDDNGYDYGVAADHPPSGASDILLILEKIDRPTWRLGPPLAPSKIRSAEPDYAFEPKRTRVESVSQPPHRRILILKLDHLGDFIMSLSALEKARARFPGAHITLIVGSWNVEMARNSSLADEVIAFDIFPRNSTEEEVDVPGKTALFEQLRLGTFDLAIDMRTDTDTRFLLTKVDAKLRAGVGARSQFPFLDIFLPINQTRNEAEAAREDVLRHRDFSWQASADASEFRLKFVSKTIDRASALVWGPYFHLRPGRYEFEPFIEPNRGETGLLTLDVAIDAKPIVQRIISPSDHVGKLAFIVEKPSLSFEFRIWTVGDAAAFSFSFYGGRLIREGGASVLHQSEYQLLLIELVANRLGRFGVLGEMLAR